MITPYWQGERGATASVAVRGSSSAAAVAAIRKVVGAIDPNVPVYSAAPMTEALMRPMGPVQLLGTVFVTFGVVSLLLAAIGLYAVMAFTVHRRVREMGIRMALGARATDIVRMIAGYGARQTIIGMAAGFLLGAAGFWGFGVLDVQVRFVVTSHERGAAGSLQRSQKSVILSEAKDLLLFFILSKAKDLLSWSENVSGATHSFRQTAIAGGVHALHCCPRSHRPRL